MSGCRALHALDTNEKSLNHHYGAWWSVIGLLRRSNANNNVEGAAKPSIMPWKLFFQAFQRDWSEIEISEKISTIIGDLIVKSISAELVRYKRFFIERNFHDFRQLTWRFMLCRVAHFITRRSEWQLDDSNNRMRKLEWNKRLKDRVFYTFRSR